MKSKSYDTSSAIGTAYAWVTMSLIIAVCAFIFATIIYFGWSVISIDFLITEPSPSPMELAESGILTPLIGTLLLTIIGIIVSFPFSLATAIYICFYAKKGIFSSLIQGAVDILSGVPTIAIALFSRAIFTMSALGFLSTMIENDEGFAQKAYGKSFLVAGITMAIMILPFVIKSIVEALKTVPQSYIDASYALGASKWRTINKIVLRSSRQGIITGVILGMGRIIGDTAIVWLALGGTLRMTGDMPWFAPQNWLSTLQNTGSTLTSYIYFCSPAGEGNSYETAFGASLVLIVIILLLNIAASIIGNIGIKEDK